MMGMEVDMPVTPKDSDTADGGKFGNLKSFVTAAREFEITHNETSVNLMNRYLGLIASSCDLSIFSPGRSEVCAFFSSLWRVMCDSRAPQWACLAVLSRASVEPSARHALTHTYKFMPILARLLSDNISNDKKIKLLTVMQDISYGIKISWQESYLAGLMKQLTGWIVQPMAETQQRIIGHKSLTVLVNVCYGNLPAIYALMRTVDTKDFVKRLIDLKEGGYGGVEVCRLLVCLSAASRGGVTRQADVHSYLSCTMRTFKRAILERDSTQLLHAYTFINDMYSDNTFKNYVVAYESFDSALKDSIPNIVELIQVIPEDLDQETITSCLQSIFKFITVIINLDLYVLRPLHEPLVKLCVTASRVCLPESLELFAAIVSQYRDEGRLPQALLGVISDGLPGLLVPPSLEPGKAGLQWLQVVGALCESSECQTQERVLLQVTPDSFENILCSVLDYMAQNGAVGMEQAQQAVITGCRVGLVLAPLSNKWEAALTTMLSHHQVRKLLCAGLTSGNVARRRQVLQLVKHHYFPSDQMNQVFGESGNNMSTSVMELENRKSDADGAEESGWNLGNCLTPAQEDAIDQLVTKLNLALERNQISDIATSSVMELYGYKMTCLEQRLHSHSAALQGASEQMASLQHTVAMLQATNSTQQDVLYTTQMLNEKHKKTIEEAHKQLEDAEATVRGLRAKLAAERMDKENQLISLQREMRAQITNIENEVRTREKEMEDRLRQAETEQKAIQKKLEQQTNKNNELAGVLIKFEERVKQRDKRLEEAALNEGSLKKEIEHKDITVKQLEKTVLERENRLYQVSTQLEEMKRVQEMVAKLMSKSTSAANAS